jgi:titin
MAIVIANAPSAWSATLQVTNTADSGPGSFRQAITTANTSTVPNTIVFQISGTPPFTITPASALPAIIQPVVIDATTQPGYSGKPVIELSGASVGSSTMGLRFQVGSSTLLGMAINRFPVQAIELDSVSNTIQGNFIGTDVTGTILRANGLPALSVRSSGNLIGGTNSGNGNLIAAGTANANSAGLYLLNGSNNIVQGNIIGLNAAGTAAFSSSNDGIILYNSSANLIGGSTAAAANFISGNGQSGIYLTGGNSSSNVIQGNYIGTDITGTNALGNSGGDGISLVATPGQIVSGNLMCSNVVSGNGVAGISLQGATGSQIQGNVIGADAYGKIALTNHFSGVAIYGGGGNQVGGAVAGAGNVISGNYPDGITMTGGTTNNVIQGNLIGLAAGGAGALRNLQNGITISNSTYNLVGGTVAAARNVISGNTNGIYILSPNDIGNVVQGNYIGTDATGTIAVANKGAGIFLQGNSNVIGGAMTGAGNVLSGNLGQGVWVVGASGNVIQGNLIGVTAAGTAGLPNGAASPTAGAGVGLSSAVGNLVGGAAAGAGNVISGNASAGLFLVGFGTSNNVVQGNYIGADVTGARKLGNSIEGIYMYQASSNLIGGSVSGAGNVISANSAQGIFLTNSSGNAIQGNLIGTAVDGVSNLGNVEHNLEFQANANNNVVGGTAPGAGNTLAYAQGVYCGVRVRTGAQHDLISGNSIFSNGALGIDLSPTSGGTAAGVNPIVACESGVVATAANSGQNFPLISDVYSGTATRVRGNFNSAAGKSYNLQFFASANGDSSGYGEGQVYLGQTNLTLTTSCSSNFTAYLPAAVSSGWVVTATATGPNNDTSEFAAWVAAIPVPPLQVSLSGASRFLVLWTNNSGSFTLEQTTNLVPPIVWKTVTTTPVLTTNYMVTTLGATNSSMFYRLEAQ